MDIVPIPRAVLDSPAYPGLPHGTRLLLIEIYRVNHDVDRFTIDSNDPGEFRQRIGGLCMRRNIQALVQKGFLRIVGQRGEMHQRIFEFVYPAIELIEV